MSDYSDDDSINDNSREIENVGYRRMIYRQISK